MSEVSNPAVFSVFASPSSIAFGRQSGKQNENTNLAPSLSSSQKATPSPFEYSKNHRKNMSEDDVFEGKVVLLAVWTIS